MFKRIEKAHGHVDELAEVWRRLKKNKASLFGLLVFIFMPIMAIFSPYIALHDPIEMHLDETLLPPSWKYPFGTDDFGRCIFSRVVFGSRLSLEVGIIAVLIAMIFGVLLGLISGYFGGKLDTLIMRCMDILLSFPWIVLCLLIVTILGTGLVNVMIAVGIGTIPEFSRLVRSEVLIIKEKQYIKAAIATGASEKRTLFRHILPNCLASIIILATLTIPGAILSAAALGFIGMGAQPPTPEWGRMCSDGRAFLHNAWWISTFPGLMIFLTVIGLNLLGDGLRDALDPRLRA